MVVDTQTDLYTIDPSLFKGVRARPAGRTPRWLKIGVDGDTGQGKTFLYGTIVECVPEFVKRPLYVDIEGGALTIADREIDVVTIRSWKEFISFYDEFYMMVYQPDKWYERTKKRLEEGKEVWIAHRYDAVCLDSITELDKLIMMDVMDEVVRQDSKRDPEVPAPREWGKGSEKLRNVVREFRNMPVHCVFIFLQIEKPDPITNEDKIRPNVHGKLAGEIPGFLDILGHLSVSTRYVTPKGTTKSVEIRERTMRFQPSGKYIAKDRSGRLGDKMMDPTMLRIMRPILEGHALYQTVQGLTGEIEGEAEDEERGYNTEGWTPTDESAASVDEATDTVTA